LSAPAPPPRSKFVTGLAWTFIGLAGVGTFVLLIQFVMASILLPAINLDGAMAHAKATGRLPEIAVFLFEHIRLFMALNLLLSAATLVSAIGLLKRLEWARVTFIAVLGFVMALYTASLALPFVFYSAIAPSSAAGLHPLGDQAKLMVGMIFGVNLLFTVGLVTVFGGIIKRLVSDEIRQEFSAA